MSTPSYVWFCNSHHLPGCLPLQERLMWDGLVAIYEEVSRQNHAESQATERDQPAGAELVLGREMGGRLVGRRSVSAAPC
jgi:hypothetical protein